MNNPTTDNIRYGDYILKQCLHIKTLVNKKVRPLFTDFEDKTLATVYIENLTYNEVVTLNIRLNKNFNKGLKPIINYIETNKNA